jgi:AcrR family transcriptional regulator
MAMTDQGKSRRLPSGAHGIPPELVARNQRERLIAGIAEACAEHGFAEVTVTEIARRASVSNVTFYEQFADKRECLLAAHEELLERLSAEMEAACEAEATLETKRRSAVRVALQLLAVDPPTARLLSVEVLAAGPAGMERLAAALDDLAACLGTSWAGAAAMAMLVARLVMAGEAERLPGLEDELMALTTEDGGRDE